MRAFVSIPTGVEGEMVTNETAEAIAKWCGGTVVHEIDPFDNTKKFAAVNVPTLTGPKRASTNMYVYKDVAGVFRVSHRASFESQYNPI